MRRVAALVCAVLGLGLGATLARAQSTASPRAPYEEQTVAVADGGVLPVVVATSVALNATTLNAMVGPSCVPSDAHRIAVTAAPVVVPVISSGRTEVFLHNVTTTPTTTISCRPDPGDGGVPDCVAPGYGVTIYPTDTAAFGFKGGVTIRCRTCPSGDGILEHMDVTCTGL